VSELTDGMDCFSLCHFCYDKPARKAWRRSLR